MYLGALVRPPRGLDLGHRAHRIISMIPNQPATWNIGLSAWIIQDGNYPDFAIGETVEFAVEFYQQPGTPVETCNSDLLATPVSDTTCRVVAEKMLETDEITVLNVGILVYREGASQLPRVEHGGRFRAELELSVDPYFYFEQLSNGPGVPPLIYSWRIISILRQSAPFIETVSDHGPYTGSKVRSRDVSKQGYEQILRTDAWQDDNGYGEYILRCDLLPIAVKRVSATATYIP